MAMNCVAPMQISMFVRSPAGFSCICRSMPITPPSAAARSSLSPKERSMRIAELLQIRRVQLCGVPRNDCANLRTYLYLDQAMHGDYAARKNQRSQKAAFRAVAAPHDSFRTADVRRPERWKTHAGYRETHHRADKKIPTDMDAIRKPQRSSPQVGDRQHQASDDRVNCTVERS